MKTITLSQLREHGASAGQIKLFEKMFGESVDITVELCESVASEFDFYWAAIHFLDAKTFMIFEKAARGAWKEYWKVELAANKAYFRERADLRVSNEDALAKYKRVVHPAKAKYKRTIARTFAKLYLK